MINKVEFNETNSLTVLNLLLIISVLIILVNNMERIIQNPNEGMYKNLSAIVDPINKKILETGTIVRRKNRMENAMIFLLLILMIANIPIAK